MRDGEGINQRTFVHNSWTQIAIWPLAGLEGGWDWEEVGKGRKSGNKCNSINNRNKTKQNKKKTI